MKYVIPLSLVLLMACSQEKKEYRETPPVLQKQIDTIIGRLGSESGEALLNDLHHLISYGSFAVPSLIATLEESPNSRLRSNAAFILGEIQDERGVEALEEALEDSDELVRYEASRSLLHQGHWTGVPTLIKGLQSPDRRVRYHCHEALRDETLKDFGFDVDASASERAQAIDHWEDWWRGLDLDSF